MKPSLNKKTTKDIDYSKELLDQKEYKVKFYSNYIDVLIGKSKKNIIIRSLYYELKLNKEDIAILTKTIYNSLDESFEFIKNSFEQNKCRIKEKNSNILKLIIVTYDIIKSKEKEIELTLNKNLNNQNYFIMELYNKFMKLENEFIKEKNNNKKNNEENNKLKQENMNMKKEIEGMKMNIMNMSNQIQQLHQQINQLIMKMNLFSMNNINLINNNNLNLNNNQNMFNFHSNNEKSGLICFSQKIKSPISIKFHDNDLLSLIIGKFVTKKKDIQIINNTKFLNPNLTAAEANLNNTCNIFIFYYYKIVFRIYGMKNDCCTIRIFPNHDNMKISELIDDYLMKIGMTRSDIQNFQYKSKILDENKTIKEEGLEDNSDIFVLTNKHLIQFLFLLNQMMKILWNFIILLKLNV